MNADVVVIGAGIVGASCAFFLAQGGLKIALVERGGIASGTSGSGEGNILLSDKEPGVELALAQRGCLLWKTLYNLVVAGKLAEATRLYRSLLPLFRYDSLPILVQTIKYCLELAGRPAGKTRPPRLALEEADRQNIEIAYHNTQAGLQG